MGSCCSAVNPRQQPTFSVEQEQRNHKLGDQLQDDLPTSGSIAHRDENREGASISAHTESRTNSVRTNSQSSVQMDSAEGLTDEDLDPWFLSLKLIHRYQRFGFLVDLQRAISHTEAFLLSIPVSDKRHLAALTNLGAALGYRFRCLGELSDLEQGISKFNDVVDLTPDDHPDKPSHLSNLGSALRARFEHTGEVYDLGEAISKFEDAANLTPNSHPDKPHFLNTLGNSFATRFEFVGEPSDLEQAISRYREAVNFSSDSHPDKPGYLDNLGSSLRIRFECLGEIGDLEEAISRQREAVNLTHDSHTNKPGRLTNLGTACFIRFRNLGELSNLEQAISMQENAVKLIPDDHPDKPDCLCNLGISYLGRFVRFGEFNDLEQAILRQRDALDLILDDHPHRPFCLNSLGNSLITRFRRLREPSDIEQAILMQSEAVNLTPGGYSKADRLHDLGTSFLTRFQHFGELNDLEQALSKFGNAVDLTPDGDRYKPSRLHNLGNSFMTRFERLGELSDLEKAISLQRDAVGLLSNGHPDQPYYLNNIGISLKARFEHLADPNDLEQAILSFAKAVDLTPDGLPEKPSHLSNLGNALFTRFECLKMSYDLEQAILHQSDAVNLTPDDHPSKPYHLNNLGSALRSRYAQLGELVDLEEAISRLKDAIIFTPNGNPSKPRCLNNLGISLRARFELLGELCDLEQAISCQLDAINLIPYGHPDRADYFNKLAQSFNARSEHLREPNDLEHVILLYSHATSASTSRADIRFHASLQWISCARTSGHHSLLHAYSSAIDLLPQLAWTGHSMGHRYVTLVQRADVVQEAVATALDLGLVEIAVEWLEQGRSIVWGGLLQLRNPYEDLSSSYPDHARRLRQLSTALEHASIAHEKTLSSFSEPAQAVELGATDSLEKVAVKHRTLALERDKLLHEIRKLHGFERFLLRKELSQLRASAHSGPIVILNAAESRCDALIVLANVENVIHVPLSNITLERSEALQILMKKLVRDARVVMPLGEREGQGMPHVASRWESILSSLWKCIVRPVLDSLALVAPGKLSRIFWCPTGALTFLPIHAAGFYHPEYSQPGHKVFDFVISSYVPSLSILAPSPIPKATPSHDIHFLAVRQPSSDGLSRLPGVEVELQHIKAILQSSPSVQITFRESSSGTVEEVLELMKEADWVHFACHGTQDPEYPVETGLCLADGRRLKLSNMIAVRRPRDGLAFLSACHTAMGNKALTSEALHIAAGMLFAGYGGVIGTMWAISDMVAPGVARDVYERLFRNDSDSARPDFREAAGALQEAVGRLRDSGASFVDWLPFIHVGT